MKPAFAVAIGVLGACGGPGPDAGEWAGRIETVNGRSVVHNPAAGVWGAGVHGRLSVDLRIGTLEGSGPEVFGRVTAIAVSSRGDIAVLDGQAQDVWMFGADGEHLGTMGRRGSGPGEFDQAVAVHFDDADRLWVVDVGNARYTLFDGAGRYLRSTPRSGGVVMGDPGVLAEGGLLDPMPHFGADGAILRYYVLVDSAGVVADTLAPVHQGEVARLRYVPAALTSFMPRVVTAPDRRGAIWLASTERYVLHGRGSDGDTTLTSALEVAALEWGEDERSTVDSILASWPVQVDRPRVGVGPQYIRSLSPDERGNLFVRSDLPREGDGSVFEMFDDRGRFLGPVTADVAFEDRPRVLFRGEAAYGVVADEFGVQYVVRARLEIPDGSSR